MIRFFRCCAGGALAAYLAACPVSATVLRLDFNDDDDAASSTQAGWTAVTAAGGANLAGTGIGLTVAAAGVSVTIDDRVRTTNGGGAEADLWEDFIFANGSDLTTDGINLTFTGLLPNRTYPVTLWMFDKSSPNSRSSTWNGQSYTFNGSDPAPAGLSDKRLMIEVITNGAGALNIQGRALATGQPHNVFLNAVEIGDPAGPATAPTDITLSPSAVGAAAAAGTPVGGLTTADPEAGDNHTYTLAAGAGSTHNGLFGLGGLDGEEVQVTGSLAGLAGQSLSIRVRSTDQHGDFLEKALAISVTNDSDSDGLDDAWEAQYFPGLGSASGTGNNDGDTLTNAQEFALGTDPTKADTDGDTLPDHLEDNTRIFNGAADPGCSPLLTDTDADGLRDDAEISADDGYVTNPNAADTDGDSFSDSFEISRGTDPTSAASFPSGLLPLRLNEIMTANSSGLADGFGDREDWIEIFNPNAAPVNLDAWYLTDDAENLTKWNFPAVSVPGGGYLVVFASTKDTTDPQNKVHTNFSLSDSGEYLALVRPDGTTVDSAFAPAFPRQFSDVSHGYHPTDGTLRFFGTPTPGTANNAGFDGVVGDTSFSKKRGFYDAAFSLAISTPTPGATIRYTTDGTKPAASTGTVYTSPIQITGTQVVRAIAYRTGWLSTNVDTHTYLFLDQVAQQPASPSYPPNLPPTWGINSEVNTNDGAGNGTVPADYAMDQRVVTTTQPGYGIRDALLSLPTVSISMPVADMFGTAAGIWANPQNTGPAWERECSVEMIEPDGAAGQTAFQENCVVETHGNSSRRPYRMQKHSLRLSFRSSVGTGKLNYPLFPASKVSEFNKLVLRACFTDSWGLVSWDAGRYRPNDSQYLRDLWMKETFRDMGQPSSYGDYCHVYFNGLYLGLFNHSERLEQEHFASHFGGQDADWEVNSDFATPGLRWNQMMALSNYADFPAYVDLANFADYMLLHIFADSEDWPHHNGYAATNPAIGFPFRFFVWDQEIALDNHAINKIDTNTPGAGALFQKLRTFPEFRLLFADRVRKQMFNGGALAAAVSGQRYMKWADRIDKAIVAESARWGDTRSSLSYGTAIQQPSPLNDFNHLNYPAAPNGPNFYFTRAQSWVVERDNVVNNYLPSLHNTSNSYATINKLRPKLLYPVTNAPDFSKFGGIVQSGFALTITAPAGTIYYTLNGTDPREAVTGNVLGTAYSAPVSLTQTGTVKARARNGTDWSALTEAQFIVGTIADSSNLVLTKIHFNPAGPGELEFVEMMNISPGVIDLTGAHFTAGIGYTFPAGTLLNPGARIVVTGAQFTGKLDNNGEELALADVNENDIFRFRYEDDAPWPGGTDGGGKCMVLIAPRTKPDPSKPQSWRASVLDGGQPGTDDTVPFSDDPAADLDKDGLLRLMEYALGTPDSASSVHLLPAAGREIVPDPELGPQEYLTLTVPHAPGTDAAEFTAEFSVGSGPWQPGVLLRRRSDGIEVWRAPVPVSGSRQFLRMKAQLQTP